jgi:hypothetical protein
MDNENTITIGTIACPSDYTVRQFEKMFYVPKLTTKTGNLSLIIFVDLDGSYHQITNLDILALQLIKGYTNQTLIPQNNVNLICDASTSKPKIMYGVGVPTVGTYIAGDKIYNIAPTAGGYTGWICTVAGTPGTWKGFGLIAS